MAEKRVRTRPQLNVSMDPEVHDRIPAIVAKARDVLGIPSLSLADAIAAGLDLFDRWIDQRRAGRTAEVESLGEMEVDPQEVKRGRPRITPPVPEGGTPPKRPRGRPRKTAE